MIPIVILASGRGSNFEAIELAIRKNQLNSEIKAVLSDQRDAPVLKKAQNLGLPQFCVPIPQKTPFETLHERRMRHESEILAQIRPFQPRFLVLAGYMRILTQKLIDAFRSPQGYSRIVNIHPSLLPAFPGKDAYVQAFQYGVKVTGVSIHLVEPEVDQGPICAQEAFSISDCQTLAEVERRGLAIEHQLYPKALNWILSENFLFEEKKIRMK